MEAYAVVTQIARPRIQGRHYPRLVTHFDHYTALRLSEEVQKGQREQCGQTPATTSVPEAFAQPTVGRLMAESGARTTASQGQKTRGLPTR